MFNFAAAASPNGQSVHPQSCALENRVSLSTGLRDMQRQSLSFYRLGSEIFRLECLECFLWCLFDRNERWEVFFLF